VFQTVLHRREREMREARARQLYCQRQPVQALANRRDRYGIGGSQTKVRADRPCPIEEEANGLGRSNLLIRQCFVR
jgi:hypothetical protein